MTQIGPRIWLGLGLGLMVSCGAPTEDTATTNYEAQTNADTVVGGQDADRMVVTEGDVWARQQLMVGIAETPVGPTLNRVITTMRVVLEETDAGWISAEETCATRIERPDLDIIGSEIPDSFIESMAFNRRTFQRVDDQISFSKTVEIQGARLRDAVGDELPQSVDDNRVFDQDEDGKPGVTVLITGLIQGELHLVQRTTTFLSGTQDGDRMEGLMTWTSEERILEASDPLLAMPVNLTPHADETLSTFVAVRIESADGCAEILANERELFGP